MGWGDCGKDSLGRPIGYWHEATCDHPGCDEKIDRGLSYACGGMHGCNEGCEFYFCSKHLGSAYAPDDTLLYDKQLCEYCQMVYQLAWYEERYRSESDAP